MEKPVIFKNASGLKLYGMLYLPNSAVHNHRMAIIISVNEIKYRIGSFRYHVQIARRLSSLGYYVLTFDPSGIGDSEGDFEEKLLVEHQNDIISGRYLYDTISAIDFLEDEVQFENLLLFGLCGGAMTSLITAAYDKRVKGAILLGLPICFPVKKESDESDLIFSKEQAVSRLLSMGKKIVKPHYWKKIIRGETNWKILLKVTYKSYRIIVQNIVFKILSDNDHNILKSGVAITSLPNYNMLFQESFIEFVHKKGKLIFIFGEGDPVGWQFKSEFHDKVLAPGNPYGKYVETYFIKQANHIFSGLDSQQELNSLIIKWLDAHFPVVQKTIRPLSSYSNA